ncbi:MAG: WD40 repeat domain-containing protein, partial [Bradymonadia bacterium]
TSVSYSWDGKRLVSASPSGTVYIWDGDTFQNHFCLEGLSYYIGSSIFAAEFSPDGHRVAGGSGFDSIWIWDAHTGKFMRELRGHSGRVSSVAFSPDGKLVMCGCSALVIYDAETGNMKQELKGHMGSVHSVACSLVKDPIRLVSGSWDHTVRIWEGPRLSFIENTLKETSACTAALIKLIVEYDGKEFDNVLCMGRVRRRERIDLPPILG